MPAHAALQGEAISSNKAALKTVQIKIATVDQNLDQLQEQQQKVRQQLVELDKKFAVIASAIKDYELQIEENTKLIHNTEKSIQQQTQLINAQKDSLNKQLKAAYVMGQHDRLKLLLNQQDPALSSRMLGYYDSLNKVRLNKMTQLADNIKLLQQMEKERTEEIQRLQPLQQGKQSEQDALLKLKQQRSVLLAQLNKEIVAGKSALNNLQEDEQNLKSLISRLQIEAERSRKSAAVKVAKSSHDGLAKSNTATVVEDEAEASDVNQRTLQENEQSEALETVHSPDVASKAVTGKNVHFAGLKGRLPWPVSGKVLQPYGSSRLDGNLQGVLIGAAAGHPVRAVANGKIAYSGWLRGYGMLTIINHGNGFMSVYAFNQSLHKRVGESVQTGETIAAVGQGGGQGQAGLYFEIRQQGNPLNPSNWCK